MGWITTSAFDVLAANDDASLATLDSKVIYKVPAGTASRAYRIVFRDYDLLDATFTVKLTIKSASARPRATTTARRTASGDELPLDRRLQHLLLRPDRASRAPRRRASRVRPGRRAVAQLRRHAPPVPDNPLRVHGHAALVPERVRLRLRSSLSLSPAR